MILQTLDVEQNCTGVYHKGEIITNPGDKLLNAFDYTWKHSQVLDESKYKYLFIFNRGSGLSSMSPDPEKYQYFQKLIRSQMTAAINAKISLQQDCLYDLLPDWQVSGWLDQRQLALQNILETIKQPEDYEILHKAHILTTDISSRDILFEGKPSRIFYNIFGSATGRLTTEKRSLPIMTLKKGQRQMLAPSNNAFVEFDLNAAEVRTLLALSGTAQPDQDIHEWLATDVLGGEFTRDEAKIKIFSWLYNFSASESRFDKFFSRQIFRDFYLFEKNVLKTPYGRNLPVEERKAQNYLLQSTTSDIVLENAYKIMNKLKNRKSKLAFTLHDSIVLDYAKEDASMLPELKDIFENTRWGPFRSTCKVGKDFKNMNRLDL